MAVILAPKEYGSRYSSLGASLGKGLSQTLSMLTQNKILQQQQEQMARLQEQQQQQRSSEISSGLSSLGVPREMAGAISKMPEGFQGMFMKQFLGSSAFGADRGRSGQLEEGLRALDSGEAGQLEQLLGQQPQEAAPPPMQQFAPSVEPPGIPPSVMPGAQPGTLPGTLPGAPAEPLKPEPEPAPAAHQGRRRDEDETAKMTKKVQKEVQSEVDKLAPEDRRLLKKQVGRMKEGIPLSASKESEESYRIQAKPTKKKTFKELLATPRPTAADKKRAEDMAMKKESLSFAKQKEVNKNTKEFFSSTMKSGKAARENDMRLKRMTTLLKKGKLTNPGFYNLLNTIDKGIFGFGINLKFLMNPDSQEFEKLTTDFTKGAKDIFGSRVTQTEIQLFLKTIPTLAQSDGGKKRVLRNWKMLNEAAKIKKKAMLEIIEMNGGQRPLGLETLVEKKVGPKLDQIAKDFAGKKKKHNKQSTSVLGGLLGGIESMRKYLSLKK